MPISDLLPTYVEPGNYIVEIHKAVDSISKAGNPMIAIRLMPDIASVVLYEHLIYNEKCLVKFNEFLASIGQNIVLNVDDRIIAEDLVWQRGYVRVDLRKFKGREFNPVVSWLPVSSPEIVKEVRIGNFRPVRVVRAHK